MKPDHVSAQPPVNNSASLPTALLRDGWVPYRFANSDIVESIRLAIPQIIGELL